MKKFFFSERTIPLALLVACFLTYGLLIPWLGFFWDDWPYIWFAKTLGASGFVDVFSQDRPFLAILYSINLPVLGSNPIVWQVFALLWRWLATLTFWKVFRLLWPERPRQALLASLLFAVYPGFSQQWISVIYSEAFIILAAFLASLGLMMAVVRKKIPFWPGTIAALILSVFNLFSTEYFFGLELLRPLLLWWIVAESTIEIKDRLKKIAIYWLPYLLALIAFSTWRAFFFQSNNYQLSAMEALSATPQSTIVGLLKLWGQTSLLADGWHGTRYLIHPTRWNCRY